MIDRPDPRRRFWFLAAIAFANAVVVITTVISGWGLLEVTLVYLGELGLAMLIKYFQVIAADRLPGETYASSNSFGGLPGKKLLAVLITLPVAAVLMGGAWAIMFLGPGSPGIHSVDFLPIFTCLAIFFVVRMAAFASNFQLGLYEELAAETRVMMPMWRFVPLLAAAITVNAEHAVGVPTPLPMFAAIVIVMAVVDAALQAVETDALRATR